MNPKYSFLSQERVASIREIQKSPSSALRGFTRVLRGTKTLGFFFPKDEFDTLLEDMEALSSKNLRARVKKARKGFQKHRRVSLEDMAARYGV